MAKRERTTETKALNIAHDYFSMIGVMDLPDSFRNFVFRLMCHSQFDDTDLQEEITWLAKAYVQHKKTMRKVIKHK